MARATPLRIVFDEQKFRMLVRGEIVGWRTPSGQIVQAILSDIGYAQMRAAIDLAERGTPDWQRPRDG
jgi:hypothetical protein